jgi:hypothetical protein
MVDAAKKVLEKSKMIINKNKWRNW